MTGKRRALPFATPPFPVADSLFYPAAPTPQSDESDLEGIDARSQSRYIRYMARLCKDCTPGVRIPPLINPFSPLCYF